MPGDLDGKLAGDPGRAKNQDCLARLELGAPGERKPSRERGIRQRGGGDIIDLLRNWQTPASGDNGALGHHPVRRSGSAAIHPSPVIKEADPVNAAHAREVREAVVMRTTRHHPLDVLQRRGFDSHHHFALGRLGIGEVLIARGLSKGM